MDKRDSLTLVFSRNGEDRIVTLHHASTGDDIDIDAILSIDYSNIYAEIVSLPLLMMRLGRLRSEAEAISMRAKAKHEFVKSERYEHYRKKLNNGTKSPSIPQIDASVATDQKVKNAFRAHVDAQKDYNDMDSIFWSLKSKDKKLDKIMESMKLHPKEFDKEILISKFNDVIVKMKK